MLRRSSLRILAVAAAGLSLAAASPRLGSPRMGCRLEQRLPSSRMVSARRLGASPGLGPACGLVSPAWLGSAAVVGRTLRRTTFRSVPPTALRVVHALSLLPNGAGSEPVEDRVDDCDPFAGSSGSTSTAGCSRNGVSRLRISDEMRHAAIPATR